MEALSFNIGAQVHCTDGRCGRVRKVVVDPKDRDVTGLIVEKGFLQKKDLVVPVSVVEHANEQDVILRIGREGLDDLREYREEEFVEPAPDWDKERYHPEEVVELTPYGPYSFTSAMPIPVMPMIRHRVHKGVSSNAEVIGRGTPVDNYGGNIGRVDHILANSETGEITHLVVGWGLLSQRVIIPMDMVSEISERSILVKANRRDLESLPRYMPRAEAEIMQEVESVLKELASDVGEVRAAVEDGVVKLTGVVRDVGAKRQAEAAVRRCSGVVDVENALDSNTAITARVTAALACDSRTDVAAVEVISEQGLVTLKGRVDREEIKEAALEIAAEQEGVIEVIDALDVAPDESSPALRFRAMPASAARPTGAGSLGPMNE